MQHLDRFGKMLVSALVMAGGAVVMLLYAEGRHADENVRLFLVEIAEHYMKVWPPHTMLCHSIPCFAANVSPTLRYMS